MTSQDLVTGFLEDLDRLSWKLPEKAPKSIQPSGVFLGPGSNGLEVAVATSDGPPKAEHVRKLWAARWNRRPSPLLLVVAHRRGDRAEASICGPAGDNPPLLAGIELSQAERLCAAALQEPNQHAAIRFLVAMLPEIEADLPGMRNAGMLAMHELRTGVPLRNDWKDACTASRPLLGRQGRELVEGLGFAVDTLGVNTTVLTVGGAKRAVAVFLDDQETFEDSGERFDGATPVAHALAVADQQALPWVVLTRGRQIRVYSSRPDVGVGRKGRADTYVELNLALLPEDSAGYLTLLFGTDALRDGGSFEQLLETSADFAADLGERLRDRVYFDAVPDLATAVALRLGDPLELDDEALDHAYEQTLVILFRLLFVAYAEDKDLLPYRTNSLYADHSLKHVARRLTELHGSEGGVAFDASATSLWDDVRSLWEAVDAGNTTWGVPAYDGGLFSDDPDHHDVGSAIARLDLTDAEFGPALTALLVDEGDDGVVGPVDFRSLSVREFGTIYEGLLESQLSVAPTDLTLDKKRNLAPVTKKSDPVEVAANTVYFHNRSGARKSTGSYFTKPFAVEHLLDHSLEPALDDHLQQVKSDLEADDEAAAARRFFDFRCADIAMGSGHFLVAAVDRIEARLSTFLAVHPIPPVVAELERLRSQALTNLGDLASGYELDQTMLLRRLVARRCIYGVDLNRIAVELARLAVWIHTFVPGLPLSFLDHNLRWGNSLTGIGTLDEALGILDPDTIHETVSIFREEIEAQLDGAGDALKRLAILADATVEDVEAAGEAHEEAEAAVEPTRQLFDILVSARLGEADLPTSIDADSIARHRGLLQAEGTARELQALHFPVAFPEVFLRDSAGFDCLLGNPPWEEVMVDEHSFWSIREPGIRSLPAGRLKAEILRLSTTRSDWRDEYEREVERKDRLRAALSCGQFPQMNQGNADVYKAFTWRFWDLGRWGGAVGVVLPRSALSGKGSEEWRRTVLGQGSFEDVTVMTNRGGWVFDDAEHRYTIALVSLRSGPEYAGAIHLRGPYNSLAAFRVGTESKPAEIAVDEFLTWSDGASFPLLPSEESVDVFAKLRAHPSLGSAEQPWRARPIQGDLNATTGKKHLVLDAEGTDGLWPVYKGASFNLWEPDTGTYYAWADPGYITEVLQEKRIRGRRSARSAFSEMPAEWIRDPSTLPCLSPRIAFRDVARATDTRTVIAALVPGNVVITNKGPYLLWPRGDERDQAYLLGVLSSVPLDWYARRVVEVSLNFHLFNSFPIPAPDRDDPRRRRVEEIAGTLAAVDDRYADWAERVGVAVRDVAETAKSDFIAELDAVVAHLYGLDERDVRHIFETFHEGWDPQQRLDAVLAHFRDHAVSTS